ncbi:hypothetical protein ABW20_dc0100049 [Dactylellina cionopaga]|nr:hypothetical protein ABW20_dc0100049 [Dactylellina cionopaga]
MLGLVQYDSDDDSSQDDQQEQPPQPVTVVDKLESTSADASTSIISSKHDATTSGVTISIAEPTPTILAITSPPPLQGPQGPSQNDVDTFGPMRPPSVEMSYPPSDDGNDASEAAPPLSPYSRTRSLLRSYTIPNLASDFSIPDSPPGSPPAATAKQFATFLSLKKKNVHFNQKLAQTTALRNPNLLENLMQHVGMDLAGQYASNWKKEIWNPDPRALGAGIDRAKGESAVQALARLQKEGFEERLADRKTVEFVGSSSSTSGAGAGAGSDKTGKSTGVGKAAQVPMSAAERVMSGLDRDRKASPALPKRDGQSSSTRRDDDRDRERDRDRNRNRDDGRRDRNREEPERKRHRSRSRERSRDRQRYRERDYTRR